MLAQSMRTQSDVNIGVLLFAWIRSPRYRVKLYFSAILIILQATYSNKLLALTKELYAKARSRGLRDGQKRCCGGETEKKATAALSFPVQGFPCQKCGSACRSRIGLHTHQRACRQGRQKSHKSSDLRNLPSLSPKRRRSHTVCCPYQSVYDNFMFIAPIRFRQWGFLTKTMKSYFGWDG